jgi:hypothetical protein
LSDYFSPKVQNGTDPESLDAGGSVGGDRNNSTAPTGQQDTGGGSNVGAIAGGVVGGILALILISALILVLVRRKQQKGPEA